MQFELESTRTTKKANPATLKRHVSALCDLEPPRCFANHESLERAAHYIRTQLEKIGVFAFDQEFQIGGRPYRNIRAILGDPTLERIVIGAHYDVAGEQPGADDNASGVAGMLEIARLLYPVQQELKHSIEVVAYTLEEPPHFGGENMGSFVHAQELLSEQVPVKMMFSLEMIGYFQDGLGTQGYPSEVLRKIYPQEGNYIAMVGRPQEQPFMNRIREGFEEKTNLPLETLNADPMVVGLDLSDHINYWAAGMNAMMVTDTAFLRNPHYHQPSDLPETLDYRRMAEVVNGMMGVIHSL